jgi:hypothetical protein
MVDIYIGAAIPPVQNNPNNRDSRHRQAPQKKMIKERRKSKEDRRQEIRSGVTVTLSKYPERRGKTDRRKVMP